MSTPILQAERITVQYEGKTAVRGVSLALYGGEFTALIGLNGCGKTSLLRAICGLTPHTAEGTRSVEGRDCGGMGARQLAREISYLPQRHSIVYDTPVLDVVMMGFNPYLGLFESPGKPHREQALAMLGKLGYEAFAGKDFLRLSEGEKQMVLLCRALVQATPVMLLDEPDSALDFVNRHRMLKAIRQQVRAGTASSLITLHDPNYALKYCDRILLMHEGELIDEVEVEAAGITRVKDALARIYGSIDVVDYEGTYYMVKKEKQLRIRET